MIHSQLEKPNNPVEIRFKTARHYSSRLKLRRDLEEGLARCDSPGIVLPKIIDLLTRSTDGYNQLPTRLAAVDLTRIPLNCIGRPNALAMSISISIPSYPIISFHFRVLSQAYVTWCGGVDRFGLEPEGRGGPKMSRKPAVDRKSVV